MCRTYGSLVLAMLVVLSTFSWTINKHVCMGRIVDVALFTQAKSCGMEAMLQDDSLEQHCCDHQSDTVQGQEDLKVANSVVQLIVPFPNLVKKHTITDLSFLAYGNFTKHALKRPPPLVASIRKTVRYCVFLI